MLKSHDFSRTWDSTSFKCNYWKWRLAWDFSNEFLAVEEIQVAEITGCQKVRSEQLSFQDRNKTQDTTGQLRLTLDLHSNLPSPDVFYRGTSLYRAMMLCNDVHMCYIQSSCMYIQDILWCVDLHTQAMVSWVTDESQTRTPSSRKWWCEFLACLQARRIRVTKAIVGRVLPVGSKSLVWNTECD